MGGECGNIIAFIRKEVFNVNDSLIKRADGHFDQMVADLRGLISIRSVLDESKSNVDNPFGPEISKAIGYFISSASKLGFRTKNISNSAAWAEVGEGEELVGVLAHMDVVPEGDVSEWKYPPYAAQIADGVLWGRGTVDDKGPAMAALYAVKTLDEAGLIKGKRIRVIVGGDEETGSRGMERYIREEEVPAYGFSPDSSFPLINAEKGMARVLISSLPYSGAGSSSAPSLVSLHSGFRYNVVPDRAEAVFSGAFSKDDAAKISAAKGIELAFEDGRTRVKAYGKTGHAMAPDKGDNALLKLFRLLAGLDWQPESARGFVRSMAEAFSDINGKAAGIARSDKVSGPLTWNAAIADIDDKKAELRVDIRYPVTADWTALESDLTKLGERAGVKVTVERHSPALFVPPETPLIGKLLKAYENVMGVRAEPQSTGGGTYCRSMPHSVSFGPNFPGEPDLDHQPNEHISLESLRKLLHIYTEAVYQIVK